MAEATSSRLSKIAVVTLILGLSSLVLSIVTALPGLLVGMWALREINGSGDRLHGRGFAIIGLIAAAASTLLTAAGAIALVLIFLADKSQREECANNLRQLGLAVSNYRDLHEGKFPPGTVRNAKLPPERRLSWQTAIVTYLTSGKPAGKKWAAVAGEIAMKEAWDAPANAGPRQTNVAPYLCPSFFRGFSAFQPGMTTYVGVAGVGLDAARFSLQDPRAGFFGYDRVLEQADITSGISTTMMVVETARENGSWLAGGTPTLRGLDPEMECYIGPERPFGGLHRDGLNVLWVDGSVRLVTERVAPAEFRATARINREAGE